ncbi:MAG TPA: phosphoribosyltransferase [Rhodocyclaceae bacterium]|nr:phosphoribosyltransferase [Rhodocyclaceae bacterium]
MELNGNATDYHDDFASREDAGRRLAKALARYKERRPVVLALPRGGVPVGFQLAQALDAPLDVLFVRKLGAPGFPELGLGAVVDGPDPQVILNDHIIRSLQVSPDYIEAEKRRQLALIEERKALYRGSRPALPIAGRTVIVTDDGIATGGTLRAGLRALARAGVESTVLAIPVAPPEAWRNLSAEADDGACLLLPPDFHSVGFYYRDFTQVTDEEVVDLLQRGATLGV